VSQANEKEGRSGPSVGVRVSSDRANVVIIFGDADDYAYYATFTPQAALTIAAGIKRHAESILNLRPETQN
jgi:hypothetical protein